MRHQLAPGVAAVKLRAPRFSTVRCRRIARVGKSANAAASLLYFSRSQSYYKRVPKLSFAASYYFYGFRPWEPARA